ncbi:MAG: hypothetical protein JKY99_04500 [Rhizobiales bacterium]|nr:hypothetical protein [Hyphomicrobiales bacterium]
MFSRLAAAVLVILVWQGMAQAMSGPWIELPNARARLIMTGEPMSGTLLAGLEIELDDEWKTYWRSPGDSGIPPILDWSRSENVASAEVQFPAPKRFGDEYGQSIGYKHRVVFPINIKLINPGRPSKLVLDTFLGICREVCIPVTEKLALTIPPMFSTSADVSNIMAKAVKSLPLNVPEQLKASFSVMETSGKVPVLEIKIPARFSAGPADIPVEDIFVEGPSNWFLSLPEKISETETHQLWHLPLYGIPRKQSPWGADMRLTIIGKNISFEQYFALDAPN